MERTIWQKTTDIFRRKARMPHAYPEAYKSYGAVLAINTKHNTVHLFTRYIPKLDLEYKQMLKNEDNILKPALQLLHSLGLLCHTFSHDYRGSTLLIMSDNLALANDIATDSACHGLTLIGHKIETRRVRF